MSELTAEAISKILIEKFPPKMAETEGGESIIDITDERTVQNSIIVSLARRVEMTEKQNKELIVALKAVALQLAQIKAKIGSLTPPTAESETPPKETSQAAPPTVEQMSEAEAEEMEEGIPQPNVRATQASSVMPNAAPAPNGSRS